MQFATTVTTTASPDQSSPFTRLPAEIRIVIYKYAAQALMDAIRSGKSKNKTGRQRHLEYRGTLALPHTSGVIRAESVPEMLAVVRVAHSSFEAECNEIMARVHFTSRGIRRIRWLASEDKMETMDHMETMLSCCAMSIVDAESSST